MYDDYNLLIKRTRSVFRSNWYATTLGKAKLSIMTLRIMTLNIKPFSIMALNIMAISIIALSIV